MGTIAEFTAAASMSTPPLPFLQIFSRIYPDVEPARGLYTYILISMAKETALVYMIGPGDKHSTTYTCTYIV